MDNNYIHGFLWDAFRHPGQVIVDVTTWLKLLQIYIMGGLKLNLISACKIKAFDPNKYYKEIVICPTF